MWRCSLAVNQNGFNSRVTSEALEERFRQVFPAQAGAELIQDLYASGVIVPTIDFTSVAEGSFLPESLQQAWDFSTGFLQVTAATPTTVINTPGFWLVDFVYAGLEANTPATRQNATIDVFDGTTAKPIWQMTNNVSTGSVTNFSVELEQKFVAFLRAGDSLRATTQNTGCTFNIWYRPVASVNGVLINPLGFTF